MDGLRLFFPQKLNPPFIAPLFSEIIVYLSSEKEDTDTKVNPQHENHHGRKTSIHIGKTAEMAEVNGKSEGKKYPCDGGKNSAWYLILYVHFLVGQKGVEPDKENTQHSQGQHRPHT